MSFFEDMHIPFRLFDTNGNKPIFTGKESIALILRLLEFQIGNSQSIVRIEFADEGGHSETAEGGTAIQTLDFLTSLSLQEETDAHPAKEFMRILLLNHTADPEELKRVCRTVRERPDIAGTLARLLGQAGQ